MPTPSGSPDSLPEPWVCQTPGTASKALLQLTLIKDRLARYQRSSLTLIIISINRLAKATVSINHRLTLLTGEVKILQEANKALSKRRRAKKPRLQDSGPLTGKKASELLVEKGVVEQEGYDKGAGEGLSKRRKIGVRLCGICRKAGYNARTCSEAEDIVDLSDSDLSQFN